MNTDQHSGSHCLCVSSSSKHSPSRGRRTLPASPTSSQNLGIAVHPCNPTASSALERTQRHQLDLTSHTTYVRPVQQVRSGQRIPLTQRNVDELEHGLRAGSPRSPTPTLPSSCLTVEMACTCTCVQKMSEPHLLDPSVPSMAKAGLPKFTYTEMVCASATLAYAEYPSFSPPLNLL